MFDAELGTGRVRLAFPEQSVQSISIQSAKCMCDAQARLLCPVPCANAHIVWALLICPATTCPAILKCIAYPESLLKQCDAIGGWTLQVLVQVADNRRLADPPLMRLESEGGHAYLSMLLQLSASQTEVQQQADVEARLVTLSLATLQRFQVCCGSCKVSLCSLHLCW